MRSLFVRVGFFILILCAARDRCFASEPASGERPTQPLSSGASTAAVEAPSLANDFVIRLGNESNQNDGIFGPLTYGMRLDHNFQDASNLELGFVRLHEPNTPTWSSVLDEAQVTYKFPESRMFNQTVVLDLTVWKNRMIDMYTNLFGVEITRPAFISINIGTYLGTASRDDENGKFIGAQFGISKTWGPVDIALSEIGGRINSGYYQNTSFEVSTNFDLLTELPCTVTASVQDRHFDFGSGRSSSAQADALIYVLGLEFHLGKLIFSKREE